MPAFISVPFLLAVLAVGAAVAVTLLLPGIDGWEALHRIRANAQGIQVPVVVVSVVDPGAPPDTVEGYIEKPFRSSQIVEKVAELIGPPEREVRI